MTPSTVPAEPRRAGTSPARAGAREQALVDEVVASFDGA